MHEVAGNGHLEALTWLAQEAKAYVKSKDKKGRMSLSCAAKNGHLKAVKCLLQEVSINVKWKGEDGKTALDLARKGVKQRWTEEGFKAVGV